MGFAPEKLKDIRQRRALRQQDLAVLSGVCWQQISRWECGFTPGVKNLIKLANALKVDVSSFFD